MILWVELEKQFESNTEEYKEKIEQLDTKEYDVIEIEILRNGLKEIGKPDSSK